MSQSTGSTPDSFQDIEFRSGDAVDLQTILDQFGDKSEKWTRWKYLENPWQQASPFEVAVQEGRIVGVAGFVPMRLTTGSRTVEAVRLGDVVQSAECYERGIGSTLVRRGLNRYAECGFALGFVARSTEWGLSSVPWMKIGPIESWYRFHRTQFRHSTVLGQMLDIVCRASTAGLTTASESVTGIRRACTMSPIEIESVSGAPAELLIELDGRDGLHAPPSVAFYRWRYGNPRASYRTTIAYRHGSPIGAIVAERICRRGKTATFLTPFIPSEASVPLPGLLTAVAKDQRDADLLIASGGCLPAGVLERLGFISDRRFPRSMFAPRRSLEIACFDPREYRPILDSHVTDPGAWELTCAETGPFTMTVSRNRNGQSRAPRRPPQQSV